jgi:ligand-binding SRPBCC domain-containing protein
MPNFQITCRVSASLPYVWSKFDQNLLAKLAPPFPIAQIIQFDGCQVNDKVCIELDFLLYKTRWNSEITAYQVDATSYVFVDEGTRVPFGIKTWRHEHRIESISEQESAVIDKIKFQTNHKLLDWLLFPLIWGMIAYRLPLYKKYLHQPQ